MALQDTDNLIVGRGDESFKIEYKELKDDIGSGGGGGFVTLDTPQNVTGRKYFEDASVAKPADYWTSTPSFFVDNLGGLGTDGDYKVHLTSGGYRDGSGLWSSLAPNGATGASQIELDPTGEINFNVEEVKPTGDPHTITNLLKINPTEASFNVPIKGDFDGNANTVTNGVYTTGNQTIGGNKTFSNEINGSINKVKVGSFGSSNNRPIACFGSGSSSGAGEQTIQTAADSSPTIKGNGDMSVKTVLNIGSNFTINQNTNSSKVCIDQTSNAQIKLQGVYANTTTGSTNVRVASSGALMRESSSLRYKKNVETMEDSYADNFIDNARPIYYMGNPDNEMLKIEPGTEGWGYWGFIAEEMDLVDPRLTDYNAEGQPDGIAYNRIGVILTNLVKRQKTQIADLTARVEQLEADHMTLMNNNNGGGY